MPRTNYSFMLRILRRDPSRVPMGRLGEYIQEFAALLGEENQPRFKGIKRASTGLKAFVPGDRVHFSRARIVQAKDDPASKPGRHLRLIESMLGQDTISEAQILDANDNVIYVIHGHKEDDSSTERLYQEGSIDGVVTGLVGADDTMHLHLRDHFDRDLKINIRDEAMARDILMRFRMGSVRLRVRGTWVRTENGWSPEASKCIVLSFDPLEDTPLHQVLEAAAQIPGNGWRELEDPIAEWNNIRGLH